MRVPRLYSYTVLNVECYRTMLLKIVREKRGCNRGWYCILVPGQISHNSGSVDVVNSQQRITPR